MGQGKCLGALSSHSSTATFACDSICCIKTSVSFTSFPLLKLLNRFASLCPLIYPRLFLFVCFHISTFSTAVESADTRDPKVYFSRILYDLIEPYPIQRRTYSRPISTVTSYKSIFLRRAYRSQTLKTRIPHLQKLKGCTPRHFQHHPNTNNLASPSKCLKSTRLQKDRHQATAPEQHTGSTPQRPRTRSRPPLHQITMAHLHTKGTPTRNRTMATRLN
jgi:hypothetical protein